MQRQRLETRLYDASYESVFPAARDAVVNHGWAITSADRDSGLLTVSGQIRVHDPRTALTLSILLPPAGDLYMDRYGWAIFDTLLWPYSILWCAPTNLRLARTRTETTGSVAFDVLGPDLTRTRISFVGMAWDSETYPVRIRRLQEEIDRQLFLREVQALAD